MDASLTPTQRRLRAAAAAHTRWAKECDRAAATKPARDGLLARFEREVDPEGVLPPEVRQQRAEQLRRAHMQRLTVASIKARAARKRGAA
jgi:hypothetical protein